MHRGIVEIALLSLFQRRSAIACVLRDSQKMYGQFGRTLRQVSLSLCICHGVDGVDDGPKRDLDGHHLNC